MARPDLHQRVSDARMRRDALLRRRATRCVAARDGVHVMVDGRTLLDFCSNDYLGMAQDPAVVAALRDAAGAGAGATASHLVCGHRGEHAALERELAQWLQCERALLFGSGYLANLGVQQALLGKGDVCVQDRLNHASLIDGAHLAGCVLRRYPHADAEAAARQLAGHPQGAALLATDGVFSMDGDVAPLAALARIAHANHALLYVDDAHGIGVLGDGGRGSVEAAGLGAVEVPLRLVTFGKALGGAGAAVVGDGDLVGHLAETARPHVYTTALPPAQAAATRAALARVRGEQGDRRRARLAANIERFRDGAARHGLAPMPSATAIQPLRIGDEAATLAMAAALDAQGYWVGAIRPPTVPEGGARLRITLSALHGDADIDGLLDALCRARDTVAA